MTFDPKTATVAQVIRQAREKANSDDPKERTLHDVIVAARLAARNDPPAAVAVAEPPVVEPVAEKPAAEAPVAEVPAVEVKETAKPMTFKSAYVSDDGVIYLIGAYAGNVDDDSDVLHTKALVKMAYDFTSGGTRRFKANHKEDLAADLVASMPGAPILKSGRVLAYGEDVPNDDPITGICLKSEPVAWFVGIRPHDKSIAEKAKADPGFIAGASWGAHVQVED